MLSGDDEITLPMLALGGDGLISVVSNVVPRLMRSWCTWRRAGDASGARELHERAASAGCAPRSSRSNPMPVKAALAMMGRFENVLRSPLVPLETKHEDARALGAPRRGGAVSAAASPPLDADVRRATASRRRHAGRRRRFPTDAEQLVDDAARRARARRRARRGARRRGTWNAVPWVKRGILLGFRVGGSWTCRSADGESSLPFFDKHTYPLQHVRRRRAACASCRVDRRCAAVPISHRASSACRRCT